MTKTWSTLNLLPASVVERADGRDRFVSKEDICHAIVALARLLDEKGLNTEAPAHTGWRLTLVPPLGHEWVAQDEDTTWCYYTHMPDLFDEYWNTTGAFYGQTARHEPYPGPWTEALFRWIDGEWVRWDRKNDCPAASPTPPTDADGE